MVPECYLVSEIAVGFDGTGSQISCDISICGVFTTAKQANDTILTWHEREYVALVIVRRLAMFYCASLMPRRSKECGTV